VKVAGVAGGGAEAKSRGGRKAAAQK